MTINPRLASRCGVEIWTDAYGFEDTHEVSNLGNVRTKAGRTMRNRHGTVSILPSRLLPIHEWDSGYLYVCLCRNRRRRHYALHRLVYQSFFGATDLIVRHLDDNKANPLLYNLTKGTRSDNIEDMHRNGKRSGPSKFTFEEAEHIRALIATGHKITHLAQTYNVSHETIRKIRDRLTYYRELG